MLFSVLVSAFVNVLVSVSVWAFVSVLASVSVGVCVCAGQLAVHVAVVYWQLLCLPFSVTNAGARLGRKGVLVGSQLGLLVVGVAIGASPSYPALAVFKLLVGTFQQVRAPLN